MLRKVPIIVAILAVLNACTIAIPVITPTALIKSIPTVTLQSTQALTSTPLTTAMPVANDSKEKATQPAISELKSVFPGMCESSILMSPDQNWLAQDCLYDSLQVIKRGGSPAWKVSYKEIFGDSEYYPQIAGGISPEHWSKDSQSLYFSVSHCCWDPPYILLSQTETLYRMDIRDGSYMLLREGLFDFSFSPTEKRVTFIEELDSPPTIEIHDMETGNINKIKLSVDDTYNQAKVDAWSSDGLKFVVKTVSGINYSTKVSHDDIFSLIIIDVSNLSQKLILKDLPTPYLEVTEWTEDDVLILKTGSELTTGPITRWQYDLKTDTLTTPTPNP
ncbi:MAG TPA: hypothetical protein VLE49_07285 [Anaerolineales bacterium]|nr:hypothetical protein [Anaerolineales bacterium]